MWLNAIEAKLNAKQCWSAASPVVDIHVCVVPQLGFWGQLILSCILASLTVLDDFASCPPSLSGKYKVGIMAPLFFAVSQCQVFAAHRVVMVTLHNRLLCLGLHYLSRHLPQAHLLLMSLKRGESRKSSLPSLPHNFDSHKIWNRLSNGERNQQVFWQEGRN